MTTMMTMRCALIVLFLSVPMAAAAQQPTPPADPENVPGSDAAVSAPASRAASWFDAGRETSAAQATARRIRRPSMVGYVNDGSIRSQVRLRLDAGNGIDAPDRAELFYAKCGCYGTVLTPDHPFYDPNAPGPGPGIATDIQFQQLYLYGEYAVNDRLSLLGELPIRWLQPQAFAPGTGDFASQGGLSDLRAGVKLGMVSTDTAALTLQLIGQFPTSNAGKGLGVDHFSFEPAVLYNQAFNGSVRLEGQFGVILPSGGSDGIGTTADSFAGKVLYYGIGPSVEIYRSDRVSFAPIVELVGWRVLDGYQTSTFSAVDNLDVVNLKIGGRFGFRDTSSIYVGYGRALTDAWWYRNILRLEYRVGF